MELYVHWGGGTRLKFTVTPALVCAGGVRKFHLDNRSIHFGHYTTTDHTKFLSFIFV
jgi:hypothetical protein